jgi:hypothetical protein
VSTGLQFDERMASTSRDQARNSVMEELGLAKVESYKKDERKLPSAQRLAGVLFSTEPERMGTFLQHKGSKPKYL